MKKSPSSRAADDALRGLYEQFPYPQVIGDLEGFVAGRLEPLWNPKTSFETFFPEAEPTGELDILVAGCGTNMAPIMAATMPAARVVGIDISSASLVISAEAAASHGLENLELHELAIEDVASLGRAFDFVQCEGVLHHLADPVRGLAALGGVTRPEGALQIMVYARYGRVGLYMLQDLCRQLGLGVDEEGAVGAQALLAALPAGHPFRLIHPVGGADISLEEVADMVLNPRDVSYRVPDVRAFVEASGLAFHRWLGNGEYRPEFSALGPAGLSPRTTGKDSWQLAELAELSHGSLLKHRFVVTHPQRRSADELFEGDALAHAIPSLAAQLKIEDEGELVSLTNGCHQVPVHVRGFKSELVPALKAIDANRGGKRTVADLISGLPGSTLELYRNFYHADVIQLRLTGAV
jgi:SAM-dependent methyltransferase